MNAILTADPRSSAMPGYEERLVAFIDTLGFRGLTARAVGPEADVSVDDLRSVLPGAGRLARLLDRDVHDFAAARCDDW